jgi:hypothetical protein
MEQVYRRRHFGRFAVPVHTMLFERARSPCSWNLLSFMVTRSRLLTLPTYSWKRRAFQAQL